MDVCVSMPQKEVHALHSLESGRKMYKYRKKESRKIHQTDN